VRPVVTAVVAITAGVMLAGCGSDTDRYCEALRENRQTLSDLAQGAGESGGAGSGGSDDVLGSSLAVFEQLQQDAPGDVRDEWDTLVFALRSLDRALDRAGVSMTEFDPQDPPPDLTDAQVEALRDAGAELRTPRVIEAGEAIEQHARDVCEVDLGL
jgi:hypothetical protein